MWQKVLGPLPKADLKTVKSTTYLAVELKKRSEEWKGANSAKIWRLDWRWRQQKGWELENAAVNVQRGGLVSIHSSILFMCAYAACYLHYTGFQAVCDVLFYLLVSQSQDGSATDQDPHIRSTLNFRPYKCHIHLYPFKPHRSYTFQHCHSSLTNTRFFQQTCILVVKINSHNKETELSAGQYYPTRSQSTNCLSLVDGWAQQMSLQCATAETKISESHF